MEAEIKNSAESKIISIKGTGKINLPDHSFEFIPQKQGKPTQKDVKQYGFAKAYTTTGSTPKRIITLQCPADATDPYNELVSQFKDVMKNESSAQFPKTLEPKGVVLKKGDDLTFTLNKSAKRLEISFFVGLEPDGMRDCKIKFYDKIQEISKCFTMNMAQIQRVKVV